LQGQKNMQNLIEIFVTFTIVWSLLFIAGLLIGVLIYV